MTLDRTSGHAQTSKRKKMSRRDCGRPFVFSCAALFFSPPSFDVSKIKIHKIRGVRLPARGGLFLGNRVQSNVYANRLLGYFIVCLRKNQAPHSFVDLSPGKWGGSAEINAADRVGGAPSLGAHGSVTAKRVEAGRGIASCCGRMCVTLHQKQFGSARGHALTTQGVGGVGGVPGWQKPRSQTAGHPASGTQLTVRSLNAPAMSGVR